MEPFIVILLFYDANLMAIFRNSPKWTRFWTNLIHANVQENTQKDLRKCTKMVSVLLDEIIHVEERGELGGELRFSYTSPPFRTL